MGKTYSYSLDIPIYECDPSLGVLPTAPMNYFQQAAQDQCETLGIGPSVLGKKGLAWFLVKYRLFFVRYPHYGERVTVETEPLGINRFAAIRRFDIYDSEGQILVHGDSEWMMMDRKKERILRFENVPELDVLEANNRAEFKLDKMGKPEAWEAPKRFTVRYLDIDNNMHVNHVKYLAWAIECLPLDVIRHEEIASLAITYKRQAFYGNQVDALLGRVDEQTWRVDIVDEDGKILCQIEIKTRHRQKAL